jgi:hypothetical protein
VEGLVIVISILLAFGIDAWWSGVQDHRLERDYLQRILADQRANEDVIAALNRQQRSQLHHARLIYPLVSHGAWDGLDTTSAVVSSYRASPTPTPVWVNYTFEELKSAGKIGLIRNSQLRSQLLEYYRFLETADYTYDLMSTAYRDAVRERLDPDLQLAIRRTCGSRESHTCRVEVAPSEVREYVAWLSANPTLTEGLRRVIVQWTRAEDEYLPGVAARTQSMIDTIELELVR